MAGGKSVEFSERRWRSGIFVNSTPDRRFHHNPLSQSRRTSMLDIATPSTSVKADRLAGPTYPDEAVVRAGQEAWYRLRSNATWDDWRQVGKAHVIGRHKAMIEAGVNQPIGRLYNE